MDPSIGSGVAGGFKLAHLRAGHGVSSISFTDRTEFALADGSPNADTLVDAASQRLHKPPHGLGFASIAQAPGRLHHSESLIRPCCQRIASLV